jgi:hypothetical protein
MSALLFHHNNIYTNKNTQYMFFFHLYFFLLSNLKIDIDVETMFFPSEASI